MILFIFGFYVGAAFLRAFEVYSVERDHATDNPSLLECLVTAACAGATWPVAFVDLQPPKT